MTAEILFNNLQSRGFTFSVSGTGLYVAPYAALTPADAVAIKAHKIELLELLGVEFTKPYLTDPGELRIPFTSRPKYHHWAGGQSVFVTLAELDASLASWRLYGKEAKALSTSHDWCGGELFLGPDCIFCASCGYYEKGAGA